MPVSPTDESWELLLSLFPDNWREQARQLGAVGRLRGFASIDDLMRTLLIHVAQGYSLRETVVRAKASQLAAVSDVALLKRLRNAEGWFRSLCLRLLEEEGVRTPPAPHGWRVRAVDGSVVKEPGQTGSQWRIHYSLQLPGMRCDHLEVTAVQGQGTGERLQRFAAQPGDLVLVDRGMCKPAGIEALRRQKAHVIVRLNTSSLPLYGDGGEKFDLLARLRSVKRPGQVAEWMVQTGEAPAAIRGRLCVVRKSEQQAQRTLKKLRRKEQQGGPKPKSSTLAYAHYVMVFTTVAATELTAREVLEWYRLRWQIELVFKRLKTLLRVGHIPKYDDQSSKAWLYGKLLVALLGEKLIRVGRTLSPWGYLLPPAEPPEQAKTA